MKKIYKLVAFTAILFSFSTSLEAQSTAGTLTFKIGEPTRSSTFDADKRVLSIWIEYNSTGTTWTFVKTLFQKGRNVPNNHTPTWVTASSNNVTGAVSSTSSFSWTASSLQTVTWNAQNVSNVVVADGNYRVAVEETWNHGTSGTAVAYFPFTKGTTAVNQTPTNASFSNMTLTWAPTLASETFAKSPEAVVYPIPSKGVFNIDLKSDVKNIQVVDLLGKVIYNEDIKESTISNTKKVDLSSFNDGVYLINVSNENGTSTYKVVLDK
jgi:hypothetical protein